MHRVGGSRSAPNGGGQAAICAEHPLSHGQRALWLLQQLSPSSPAYNSIHAARIPAEVDPAALHRTLKRIVGRHPCLRATFHSRGGEPVQVIHEAAELVFRVEDASTWSDRELDDRLAAEAYRPFDLERGPLMRALLVKRAERDHVLAVTVHHIVIDLWSWALFLRELGEIYTAEVGGRGLSLPPVLSGFGDHVRAESELLAGSRGEELWAYWKRALAGEVPAFGLLADRQRPPSPTFRGGTRSIRLDAGLTRQLKSLGRECRATPFMTLLTAFQILLQRYSGQEDFLVGSVSAGRTAGFADVVGYFANLVALRCDLAGDPSFKSLLSRVRGAVREAFEHARFPHALLVERLRPARSGGFSPLVQTLFTWQKTTPLVDSAGMTPFALGEQNGSLQLSGLRLEAYPLREQPAPFELTLLMAEAGSELAATMEYQTDLFDGSSISLMLDQFAVLLRHIVANPEQPISTLPLVDNGERHRVSQGSSRAALAASGAPLVHEVIRAKAQQAASSVAVTTTEVGLTYGELDRGSNRIAHHLRALGVGPEVIVGVLLERSTDLVTALLGVLKAGGAYLPLDPAGPPERLAFMLDDARPRVLLTRRAYRERVTAAHFEGDVVLVDGDEVAIAQASSDDLRTPVAPDDVAYIIYTSGSTGQPKGVLIPHSAIAAHCRDVIQLYELGPNDRVLQFASACFDASLEQILPALMCGATLVLRRSEVDSGSAFHSFVSDQQLTVVNVPPAYWREWARACAGSAKEVSSAQLRLVIIGGDALPPDTLELWRRTSMRGVRLLNAYGPTETTITATTYEVPGAPGQCASRARVPIGRAVGARTLHVLDRHGHLVPAGVPGELHIGGPYLARGYLKRPELTAERFVSDPFSDAPGARLYRTGDLVRRLADGNVEFLGRLDDQVKIRGYRIELSEIETVLSRHPRIREAIVLVQEVDRGAGPDRRLVAYVATRDGVEGADDLRGFLKARLPEYMVPAAFVRVDSFPRSAGGKVDRAALPLPDASCAHSRAPFVEARSPLEAEIARIWSDVLGVERVGIRDDFFELGGHSLLGTRIVSRLRDAFGVELPLRCLFEAPTVEELALATVRHLAQGESEASLDDLLEEIEQLSEGEARAIFTKGE